MRDADESRAWPKVPGKITKSRVEVTTTRTPNRNCNSYERNSHSYSAEIEYEFAVDGVTHHGSRVAVVSDQFGDEGFAQATCEKYPLNKAVSVIGLAIWGLIDGRVRDSRIDWTRGTFRSQVGWSVHEFPLDEISDLTFRLPWPKPIPNGADASLEQSKTFTARLFLNVSGRKFLLLKTEFVRRDRSSVREKLAPAMQQLAQGLNVPLQEDISPP